MSNAEITFEMDEKLWWQVRKHAQLQGMSVGEMTTKALGEYMIANPITTEEAATITAEGLEQAGTRRLPTMESEAAASVDINQREMARG